MQQKLASSLSAVQIAMLILGRATHGFTNSVAQPYDEILGPLHSNQRKQLVLNILMTLLVGHCFMVGQVAETGKVRLAGAAIVEAKEPATD